MFQKKMHGDREAREDSDFQAVAQPQTHVLSDGASLLQGCFAKRPFASFCIDNPPFFHLTSSQEVPQVRKET
jgi:hypothetical protein